MQDTDITAILERLLHQGQRAVADLNAFAELAAGGDTEALLQHLRELSQRFFVELRQQLQDQAMPWTTMLRTWAQMSDGGSLAEILMTPMSWWQPGAQPGAAASPRQVRVEAAAAELAAARDAYLQLLQAAAESAVERFAARLDELQQEPPDARQLYQHWLETAEAAYEETMMSEAFTAATGRLTNAWSELLLLLQDNLDGVLAAAGLPTRRELTETQAQLHELRQLQRQRERQLRNELSALQDSIADLRAAGAPKPKRKPTPNAKT